MTTAILLSGGTGTRLGASVPKQYLEIHGKSIIFYSLKTLLCFPAITSLRIVAGKEWRDLILACVDELQGRDKLEGFSDPGENRQESIRNALEDICKLRSRNAEKEYVLIHDAARPFLTTNLLHSMFEKVAQADGVLPVLPMKDTVYYSEDGKQITSLLERSKVLAGQAPELFDLELYYKANQRLTREELLKIHGSTEPAIMAGMKIEFVKGDESNFKITTIEDLERAQSILGNGIGCSSNSF